MPSKDVKYRVSMLNAGLIVGICGIIDLLQLLLDFSVFLSFIASVLGLFVEAIVFVWFQILGVNYLSGKRSVSKFSTTVMILVVEIVPILDALPALTVGTVLLIRASRAEDREKHAEQTKAAQKKAQQQAATQQRRSMYYAQRANYAAANDNEQPRYQVPPAANDNDAFEEEDYAEAA